MVFARLKAGRVGTYLIDLFHVCAYYVRDLESPGTAKEWLAAVVLEIGTRLSDSVNEGDRTNDKRSALVPQSRETSDSDENALVRCYSTDIVTVVHLSGLEIDTYNFAEGWASKPRSSDNPYRVT